MVTAYRINAGTSNAHTLINMSSTSIANIPKILSSSWLIVSLWLRSKPLACSSFLLAALASVIAIPNSELSSIVLPSIAGGQHCNPGISGKTNIQQWFPWSFRQYQRWMRNLSHAWYTLIQPRLSTLLSIYYLVFRDIWHEKARCDSIGESPFRPTTDTWSWSIEGCYVPETVIRFLRK